MSYAAPAANVAGVGMPDADQGEVPREPPRPDQVSSPWLAEWGVALAVWCPHEMRRGTVRPGGR